MAVVIYIFIGSLSVVGIGSIDLDPIRAVKYLKPIIMIVSIGIFILSLILLIRLSNTFDFPSIIRGFGLIITGTATILFIFTLFIEIPIANYIHPESSSQVISTGTYALARHPGIIWATLFLAGLFLATGARMLLTAGPIWVFCDVALAIFQDKVIFPRRFGKEYDDYKQTVPMIIPTVRSLSRCMRTISILPKFNK